MKRIFVNLALVSLTLIALSCSSPGNKADTRDLLQAEDGARDILAVDTTDSRQPGKDAMQTDTIDMRDAMPVDTRDVVPPPPKHCNTFVSPWGHTPLFVDKSARYNLDAAHLNVLGNRLAAVDINNDGYPDLIVHQVGQNDRDDPNNGVFKRRILLNVEKDGHRTFEDYTVQSKYGIIPGTNKLGRSAQFAVFADVDNDGDLDCFSGNYLDLGTHNPLPDRSIILLNNGKGIFSPAPASAVTPKDPMTTTAAAFVDYNQDGKIDLWVGFFYQMYGYPLALQDRLYQGNGDGTFVDVTNKVGLTTTAAGYKDGTNHRPTYGVTACDVDGDGDDDLLCSAYGRQLNMLWQNNNGTFKNIAHQVHFDADDITDYSDNQFYACYCQHHPNTCNPDPGTPLIQCPSQDYWRPGIDDQPWRLGGNTFTTLCADFDNDGDLDLYNAEITHWHIGKSSDPSQWLVNEKNANGGFRFIRPGRKAMGIIRPHSGGWNEGDIYAVAADFDNDGNLDLFQPSSDYPGTHGWLFRGDGKGKFEDMDANGNVSGLSLQRIGGVAVADFDRDGDLDVVVAFSTMRCDKNCEFKHPVVRFFENQLNNRANWTSVRLVGAGPPNGANRSGIGAKVYVTTGSTTQLREISGGYGTFGIQNPINAHFGLGSHCQIDTLRVQWPDKAHTTMTFHNVVANYQVVIDEATGTLSYVLPTTVKASE